MFSLFLFCRKCILVTRLHLKNQQSLIYLLHQIVTRYFHVEHKCHQLFLCVQHLDKKTWPTMVHLCFLDIVSTSTARCICKYANLKNGIYKTVLFFFVNNFSNQLCFLEIQNFLGSVCLQKLIILYML